MKSASYYCVLCQKYGIKLRAAHLIDSHKATRIGRKRATWTRDTLDVLFRECK